MPRLRRRTCLMKTSKLTQVLMLCVCVTYWWTFELLYIVQRQIKKAPDFRLVVFKTHKSANCASWFLDLSPPHKRVSIYENTNHLVTHCHVHIFRRQA